eukprot:s3158_g12.t1
MAGTLLVADGLTKALQKQAFEEFLKKLKMSVSDRPVLNKMEKIHDIPKDASDMLYCNHKNEAYYKKMMALALAALALLLTGELQTAAVVLIALKCCNVIYEEMCKRAKAPLPEEVSTSEKKGFEKVTQEIEMRLKAFHVRTEVEDELPLTLKAYLVEKPRGDDRWYPMLIRKHGKRRQRCFHPLHRSCPVDSIQFEPVRYTVIFYEEQGRTQKRVIKDDWTGTPTVIPQGDWKGYTATRSSNSKISLELPPHS